MVVVEVYHQTKAGIVKMTSSAGTSNVANTTASISGGSASAAGPSASGAESELTAKPAYPRLFNKIVLTLENSLIPEAKLNATPSHVDGLDPETEKDLRILGCELIQTAGILLKLPQVAMATGQVIFQRFFYSKSFVRYNMETVAMSCVCLASKIEEAPRRIRDVINVFHHIKQVRAQKDIAPMILDQAYTNLKTQVIKAERRVLKELGFCVHVKHPHKLIVMYLQVMKYEKHEKLMQMSWNFMNDSLRTDVFMRYQPETIACACIYLSARKLVIPLPNNPPWFGIFRVSEDHIVDICYRIMELYMRAKPNVEKLDAAVEELKKRYMESRNKNKEQNTPPAVTTVDRNNGSHNAWGGFIQRAIPLPLPTENKSPDKDSRSRSRTRSRSRGSRSPKFTSRSRSRSRSASNGIGDYKSRNKKTHRSRSRSRSPPSNKNKKKSRHYSRSPSSSPHAKHRKRKSSREHERNDYYSNKERMSTSDKYRERDKYQEYKESSKHHHGYSSKHHHGYSNRGSSHRGGQKHRSSDHERSRDRKR
ncbi:cyclin-L1 [Bactrocera neohumeralis]|uniref:cyclin-L1 n=1 Tax=Bactrocera tryoni TaxID=59916 RepID=UPI001A99946D|nr:cyclin-L1 [Bactrocera tryoni]XP_050329048.1 cyclin-L1 [Bactrocera neohumeralis]